MYPRRGLTAQLACVRHAASVHSEPGSNSPVENFDHHTQGCDGHFTREFSLFELVVPVARRLLVALTEVRQFLDPVFKEPAPELGSSSYVGWVALSSRSTCFGRVRSSQTGAQRYGRSGLLSTPFFDFSEGISVSVADGVETTRSGRTVIRAQAELYQGITPSPSDYGRIRQ